VNFGFWGSEPQTLNLRNRWYGGISRGGRVWSCGERILRVALSVPEIYDLKVLRFDLICIQTGSGRGQITSSPDRGYNPSLGHDIAGSRYGDIRRWIFCPFPLRKKFQLTSLVHLAKNTWDGVDKKLLHNDIKSLQCSYIKWPKQIMNIRYQNQFSNSDIVVQIYLQLRST